MLKKIYILFIVLSIALALYTPIRGFDKPLDTYNAIDIVSGICFYVIMLGCITYILSGIVIELYFKLKRDD